MKYYKLRLISLYMKENPTNTPNASLCSRPPL